MRSLAGRRGCLTALSQLHAPCPVGLSTEHSVNKHHKSVERVSRWRRCLFESQPACTQPSPSCCLRSRKYARIASWKPAGTTSSCRSGLDVSSAPSCRACATALSYSSGGGGGGGRAVQAGLRRVWGRWQDDLPAMMALISGCPWQRAPTTAPTQPRPPSPTWAFKPRVQRGRLRPQPRQLLLPQPQLVSNHLHTAGEQWRCEQQGGREASRAGAERTRPACPTPNLTAGTIGGLAAARGWACWRRKDTTCGGRVSECWMRRGGAALREESAGAVQRALHAAHHHHHPTPTWSAAMPAPSAAVADSRVMVPTTRLGSSASTRTNRRRMEIWGGGGGGGATTSGHALFAASRTFGPPSGRSITQRHVKPPLSHPHLHR